MSSRLALAGRRDDDALATGWTLSPEGLTALTTEHYTLSALVLLGRGQRPEITPYLVLPTVDERAGVLHNTGVAHGRWHHLSHMAVMVAVVVGAVTGTATAMAVEAAGGALDAAVPAGVASAVLTLLGLTLRQIRAWHR